MGGIRNGGRASRADVAHLAALAFAFAALAPAAAGEFAIGVLYWSMSIPGQVAMRAGLEAEAKAINRAARAGEGESLRLEQRVAGDGEAGVENQIRQMRELIALGLDAIVVQPTDNAALSGPLREANAAGIPVVAYDQYISGGKLAAYRTSDNYQAGFLDGEYAAARFPAGREIRLVLVEYARVSSTVERVDGFLDALGKAGRRYRVLKSYTAVEPVGGAAAGEGILRDFPAKGSVDLVFTVNDGGGLKVVEKLLEAGRTEIAVATIDGDPDSIANIKAGRLTIVDSAQFCGPLGAAALRAAYDLLQGRAVHYHALVPVFPVAKETLALYPGWAGPIPEAFDKPWPSSAPRWDGRLRVVVP